MLLALPRELGITDGGGIIMKHKGTTATSATTTPTELYERHHQNYRTCTWVRHLTDDPNGESLTRCGLWGSGFWREIPIAANVWTCDTCYPKGRRS